MTVDKTKKDWYTNKELFEMMQDLKEEITETRSEMCETKMLIRDYNGLRQRVDKCEQRLDQGEGGSEAKEQSRSQLTTGIMVLIYVGMLILGLIPYFHK